MVSGKPRRAGEAERQSTHASLENTLVPFKPDIKRYHVNRGDMLSIHDYS